MEKAKEIKVFDANEMKNRLSRHIVSARYRGIDDVPMGYESSNIAEFLRGYERGAIDTANIALGQKLVDAVEVVRCKECEFSYEGLVNLMCGRCGQTKGNLRLGGVSVAEDHFCGYGKRREKA